jgi:hypothetical protein
MKSTPIRFVLAATLVMLAGCDSPGTALEELKEKQALLLEAMRSTMANHFFLWSVVLLLHTFFGSTVVEACRGWGVHLFRLSLDTQKKFAWWIYGLTIGIAALFTLFEPNLSEIRMSIFLLLAGTLVPFTQNYLPGLETGDRNRRKLAMAQITKLGLACAVYYFILKILTPEGLNGLTLSPSISNL